MADLAQDKRQHKRFKVMQEGLIGKLDDDQIVDITDLSVGGVAMKASSRLAVGREYIMRLYVERSSLEVRGTVVRSRVVGKKEALSGQQGLVYASAMRLQEGWESRVVDFIYDAQLI